MDCPFIHVFFCPARASERIEAHLGRARHTRQKYTPQRYSKKIEKKSSQRVLLFDGFNQTEFQRGPHTHTHTKALARFHNYSREKKIMTKNLKNFSKDIIYIFIIIKLFLSRSWGCNLFYLLLFFLKAPFCGRWRSRAKAENCELFALPYTRFISVSCCGRIFQRERLTGSAAGSFFSLSLLSPPPPLEKKK